MKTFLPHLSFALLLSPTLTLPSFSQDIIFNTVSPTIGNFYGLLGITQDKNGYMWIASENGLYRYDGYSFKMYVNDPSNPNSLAESHLETDYATHDGLIWIATWQTGLDRLDPQTGIFTHFRYDAKTPSSISSDLVRAILEDHEGTLWIGTHGGLDRFDPKTGMFQHYQHDAKDSSSLSCNKVRALYEDREGTLWVGTGSVYSGEGGETPSEGGLNRFDRRTGKFARYLHNPKNLHSLINNKVGAIFEDSKGVFWVGTAGDGLHTMDRATGTFERHPYDPKHPEKLSRPSMDESSSQDHITFINEDAAGSVWIGTLENGLNRYDRKLNKVFHYGGTDTSGFYDRGVWSVSNSRDGILWIGGAHGTLYRTSPLYKKIQHIDVGGTVWGFAEQAPNIFWIATEQGLFLRDMNTGISKKFIHKPLDPNSLTSSNVLSIYEDSNKALWIATENGFNRLDPRANTFTRYQNDPKDSSSVSPGSIFAIMGQGQDSIWIGNQDNGLDLMDNKKGSFSHFRNNPLDTNSLGGNFVVSLLPDHLGNLWIGTYDGGGVNYLDRKTKRFKHFLKGSSVLTLYEDSDSILWVGTDAGLYKSIYTDATAGFSKVVDPSNNLENIRILSICEDNQKWLWVGTAYGLYKINPKNNQTTLYGASNGVIGGSLNYKAGYKGKEGQMYFGDSRGYYVFSPDELNINTRPPEIVFSDLRIGGKSQMPGTNSPLLEPIESIKELSLKYYENTISIDFAGINYIDPVHNRHLYMLENHDNNWQEVHGENTASYFDLPPGEYTFRVKAANSSGVWAERALKIRIAPPWWMTWWAYSVYALCIVALIYVIFHSQRKRIINKERKRTLERELLQAKEIEKAYHELKSTQAQLVQSEKMASLGELTAGIAHEIQNPLNFVNNFSEVNSELIDEMKKEIEVGNIPAIKTIADDLETNMEKITHHGKRADAIVKSMLQHSRTSAGQKEPTDINSLADEYLRLSYHGLRAKDKSFNASIKTDFDENIGKINIVAQDIGRVLLNLINNAFYSVTEKKKQKGEGFEPIVTLTTKRLSDQVEIKVRDNGLGIPQKIVDKIYQPFFTTKPSGQGTGLGLSLSYDIVAKEHGGEIKMQTKEGEGAEFIINIPLT